ncbi:MAG: hypothetical protein J7539_03395 [Niabella sp.]|nr:hypothetical protein [Niabella sp.]
MSYSDTIQQIRNARTDRDTAKEQLYALQMQYQQLLKQQRAATNGNIIQDAQLSATIDQLRQQIAALSSQLNTVEAQLNANDQQKAQLLNVQQYLQQVQDEISTLQNKIDGINNELQNGDLTDVQKQELAIQRDALQQQVTLLKQKAAALQQSITSIRNGLLPQQDEARLRGLQSSLTAQINELQTALNAAVARGTQQAPDQKEQLAGLEAQIGKLNETVKGKTGTVSSVIGQLLHQNPQQLIESWNDTIPILLQPVRMETKFSQNELWVRIYPDDIAIVTHEKMLMLDEITYGITHWKEIWNAKDDADKKQAVWKVITDSYGLNRSAWIVLQTKPSNWANAATLASADDLIFPTFDTTKPDSWTQAAHTKVMPDRFVLLCYRGGILVHTQLGNPIDDIIIAGPAPVTGVTDTSISRDATTGEITYSDDFIWIKDFDNAVGKGMGFKVPLDQTSAVNGFDEVLAVGLKLSADETDGQQLLEELLTNHRYGQEGLSLIQQGTPTNNTDDSSSGYSQKQTIDDIAGFIEKDQRLFTPANNWQEATDGQRLADYLGISYELLQTTQNSQLTDHMEALAANNALYAGTLGYYMHNMLQEVLSDAGMLNLRNHFTSLVTGRGPLASIKVGSQPYGIIVTSDFSNWNYPQRPVNTEFVVANTSQDAFYRLLYNLLGRLQTLWQSYVPKLATISSTGDADANLLQVLGLNPTSVDFYQRIAFSMDYLQNLANFKNGGKYAQDILNAQRERSDVIAFLKSLGYQDKDGSGKQKPFPLLTQLVFQHYQTRLDNLNLVDGPALSETDGIAPYDKTTGENYMDWLLKNATNTTALQQVDFGGNPRPTSTLFMLLLYAQLHEASQSIYQYLLQYNIVAKEIVQSRKFMNISSSPSITHWEVFDAPVNKIVTDPSVTEARPLLQYIFSLLPTNVNLVQNLAAHQWGLNILKSLPGARLERLLVEHLDTLSYRLDAWETSLFDQRLQAQRNIAVNKNSDGNNNIQRNTGIYMGAYGYLEKVKPGNKRTRVREEILPRSLWTQQNNLYTEAGNGGYVQAPTLNHATAAAILRNGFLTHANPAEKELLTVNLSSERVRRAKGLLEGIQNGQTLEALLGYQFERGLHDWTTRPVNPVILDMLIPAFRDQFPITKTKVPQNGNVTGPEETIKDYSVVNGLALANITVDFPYGIAVPVALSNDQINAVKEEKKGIEDTLDAMRDLLTAESAYQLALGNFDRAAAVMQAISGASISPEPEIIGSSRGTDLSFTNKVVVHFDNTTSLPAPWAAIPLTQRALTEPGLNSWLTGLLGDPTTIKCAVAAVDSDGNILKRPDNSPIAGIISLDQLAIQAIDLVYLTQTKQEASGTSELETRIRYRFAQDNQLTDGTIIKITFTDSGTADLSTRSFAEILPLASYLKQIVSAASALAAKEYEPASKTLTNAPGDNANNIQWAELQNRAANLYTNYQSLSAQLNSALTDVTALNTAAAIEQLRNTLVRIANAGFAFAFPHSCFGDEADQASTLVAQGNGILAQFSKLFDAYNSNLATVNKPATTIDQKVPLLTAMIRSFLGDAFKVMPVFNFNNIADVTKAADPASRAQLRQFINGKYPGALPVDEWLHGTSLVRPALHKLEMVRLLNDTLNGGNMELSPLQLPYRDNDTWLATEYPDDTSILQDTFSVVQLNFDAFNPTGNQCGLLIDAWTETIPNKEEVTGIAFNYNQPNTVPPQALLLAVTPQQTGSWKWDHLVNTILDTFARAKRRAVEPDHIDTMSTISTLLPALITEFSTSPFGISLDQAINIKFIAKAAYNINMLNPVQP